MSFVKRHLLITHILFAAVIFTLGFALGKVESEKVWQNSNVNAPISNKESVLPTDSLIKSDTVGAETKLVFMRKYTLSGEMGIVEESVSANFIGLDKNELSSKFEGWTLRSFDKEKVVFYKEIDSYSDSTYLITTAEDENKTEVVCVYKFDIEGNRHLYEKCASPVELFDELTREKLREGIVVNSDEELKRLLEEYDD